jgi:uncharacterized membrane protein
MTSLPLTTTTGLGVASPEPVCSLQETNEQATTRRRRYVLMAAVIALVTKLAIAWNTFGTNDVLVFYLFGRTIAENGLEAMYRTTVLFNHPPLTAYYLRGIFELQRLPAVENLGVTFPFLVRLPGIVSDFIVVWLLVDLGQRLPRFRVPTWALVLFAASPVSVMVSGYHGNTDPVMVLFLVLAAYFCVREQASWSGIFFALSVQVKVIPLLFLPFFCFFWLNRRAFLRFSLSATLVSVVLWAQPLFQFPRLFIKDVLSYSSYWGIWGLTYLLRLTGWQPFAEVSFFDLSPAQNFVINLCKVAIVVVVLLLAWRQRKETSRELWNTIAFAWLVFFAFAPGVCTQYLIWLAPFILILSPSFYAWVTASSSIFAFVFYDTISRGLPWFRGISTNAINKHWTAWTVIPWIVLMVGCCLFARRVFQAGPAQSDLGSNDDSVVADELELHP